MHLKISKCIQKETYSFSNIVLYIKLMIYKTQIPSSIEELFRIVRDNVFYKLCRIISHSYTT